MKDFNYYLREIGEVGFVEAINYSIVYATGLPLVRPSEIVIFESSQLGQILSVGRDNCEVLVLSRSAVKVGSKIARTNEFLEVPVGEELLGRTIDPLCYSLDHTKPIKRPSELRSIDNTPSGISTRRKIKLPFETGVSLVDLLIPLGKGQRELVVGDRKTGKTSFLLQTVLSQARQGTVCIYAAIGKSSADVKLTEKFFAQKGITDRTIIVASVSQDPASIIFLTPYTAMTLAEYFRDKGKDVLVIFDDLTTHAKYYREISLLARRFPGRDSYPGDIFYTHSRLLERGGNFVVQDDKEVSISCLPVAETAEGDLTGYIQTNLMSMTDGHIYFDSDYFSRGRRPAINPFISVTRVGRQTQSSARRDINREVTTLLALFERSQSFSHFGGGLSESLKFTLSMGERAVKFFDQSSDKIIPGNVQVVLFGMLWLGLWQGKPDDEPKSYIDKMVKLYEGDSKVRSYIDNLVLTATTFNGFLNSVKKEEAYLLKLA